MFPVVREVVEVVVFGEPEGENPFQGFRPGALDADGVLLAVHGISPGEIEIPDLEATAGDLEFIVVGVPVSGNQSKSRGVGVFLKSRGKVADEGSLRDSGGKRIPAELK